MIYLHAMLLYWLYFFYGETELFESRFSLILFKPCKIDDDGLKIRKTKKLWLIFYYIYCYNCLYIHSDNYTFY